MTVTLADLLRSLPLEGRLEWIGLRPARRAALIEVGEALAVAGLGLEGDHGLRRPARLRALTGPANEPPTSATAPVLEGPSAGAQALAGPGKRNVTLIQAEHLPVIAALLGREQVTPDELRRNLVVSGINLLALKDRRFWVGEVLLEGTGACHPCSRMEEALGPGGYNAVRGHGGLTARVVRGGTLRLGDPVRPAG
ncbi:MOSC domain-containing protein YiiM [Deinobacterium chartae]|uniref:MOSC domain-containing protein YiiM n=1 Tax=Deinobacterium chartae TaxID=521158 RepID=A0A841I4U3_9DEIO|nr:MOSC domain-containing protein YiiM [Deinobacterium chartae]